MTIYPRWATKADVAADTALALTFDHLIAETGEEFSLIAMW